MSRIVSDIVSCENQIQQFFHNQKMACLLKCSNIRNQKGISPVCVFLLLFTLVFTGRNLFRTLEIADGTCEMAKSFLNLARECQARSFDALTAHATVVCCRYIMLELARRVNKDPRSLGSLFHATCEELKQDGFVESLAILLTLFEQTLTVVMGISKELIHSLMDRFLDELPPIYRTRLLFP